MLDKRCGERLGDRCVDEDPLGRDAGLPGMREARDLDLRGRACPVAIGRDDDRRVVAGLEPDRRIEAQVALRAMRIGLRVVMIVRVPDAALADGQRLDPRRFREFDEALAVHRLRAAQLRELRLQPVTHDEHEVRVAQQGDLGGAEHRAVFRHAAFEQKRGAARVAHHRCNDGLHGDDRCHHLGSGRRWTGEKEGSQKKGKMAHVTLDVML